MLKFFRYIGFLATIAIQCVIASQAFANTWYVSPSGSDSNSGTRTSPFATLNHAVNLAGDWDTVYLRSGNYYWTSEQSLWKSDMVIETDPNDRSAGKTAVIHGSSMGSVYEAIATYANSIYFGYINIADTNGNGISLNGGNSVYIYNVNVQNCTGSGIRTTNMSSADIGSCQVTNCVTSNSSRPVNGNWSSPLSIVTSSNVNVHNCTSFNNYGEGILIETSHDCTVQSNKAYNNFSVNIYIDNSYNVQVTNNSVWFNNNNFTRNGNPSEGITCANENASSPSCSNITVQNNYAGYCAYGFVYHQWNGSFTGSNISNNTFQSNLWSPLTIEGGWWNNNTTSPNTYE